MPIYEYKAFASGGAIQTGIVDADTERDARAKLRRDNLLVSKLTETRGAGASGGRRARPARARSVGSRRAGPLSADPVRARTRSSRA